MAYKQLYINGVGSGTYGIYINSDTYLNAPNFDYTEYAVPARNGNLLQYNKRLHNVVRSFDCFIPDNAMVNMDGFKKLLYSKTGYLEISSDYESDTYQYGYLVEELAVTPFLKDSVLQVTFTLQFSCMPQKFFKTNYEQTRTVRNIYCMGILSRSHPLIQKMLSEIPVGDIPDEYGYLVWSAEGSDSQTAVTALTASVANYTGFIASGFIYYDIPSNSYKWHKLIAYSNTGSLAITGSHTPTVNSDVCVVIPVLSDSTIETTVTRGSTETRENYLSPCAFYNVSNALGVSYQMYVGGNLNKGNPHLPTGIFVRGYLNHALSFEGLINIDGYGLANFLDNSTQNFNVDYSINSETLNVRTKKTTESGYSSGNEFTGVEGRIEGLADRLEIYAYQPFQSDVFTPSTVKITPRWWKV